MKVKINSNKRIGKIIYIVEGDVDEAELIVKIYNQLLGYSIVKYCKITNKYTEMVNSKDKYSKVYIIPSEYSAVNKLLGSTKYLDEIYHKLAIDYELDIDNAAIYYLFDRDRKNNRPADITDLMNKLGNSRDNDDFEMNGLLLLSYPSIEAFYTNANDDSVRLDSGINAKEYIKEYKTLDLNSKMLEIGAKILLSKLEHVEGKTFDHSWLDHFSDVNVDFFDYEETEFSNNKNYDTLSFIFVSFIDIGIIEIE